MSPEQFAGKEVTVKSDIYALGLVLYEVFTGKRVFEAGSLDELRRMHESSAPPTPSSWVKNIDPLVERVILRCLEKDPAKRLASAKQVADALPGGDPLAAALALGETPTPEMVAAAGAKTGLRPKVAVACLLATIIGLFAAVYLQSKVRLIDVTPFENSPEVLSRQAREIIAQLGYPARPIDTAHGFDYDRGYLNYLQWQVPVNQRKQRLGQSRPAAIFFWYRESPQQMLPLAWPLGPRENGGQPPDVPRVKESDPPSTPGMASVRLDMQGRLIRFNAAPLQLDLSPARSPEPGQTDWAGLFAAAGIDIARLSPTEPKWTPPSAFDARAAWIGSFPEWPDLAMRVETATWRGRPVYFEVIAPWATPDEAAAMAVSTRYTLWIFVFSSLATVFLGGWLVWRNLRQGRSDRKGAFKLASFVFINNLLAGIIGSFVPTLRPQEWGLRLALQSLVLTWVLYIALEPYVRRRWPVTLISWSRVLAGNVRDPLVGRDVLFGILAGVIIVLNSAIWQSINSRLGVFSGDLDTLLRSLSGTRLAVSLFLFFFSAVVIVPLVHLFALFLLRLLTRRDGLAASLFTVIYAIPPLLTGDWTFALSAAMLWGLTALMLIRYGLMTMGSSLFVGIVLGNFPITLNFSAWYVGTGILPLLFVLALAVLAFYTSLGGQKVFEGKLLEE
jgi:serine/threonine-protein kinase